MTSRVKIRPSTETCADCSAPGPAWASVNRGVVICDECVSVHRSLGRHISQVKHLQHSTWSPTLRAMVNQLVTNGANSIWEHSLLDPNQMKSGIRKPNPKDKVHPTKSNFIKAKYHRLAFIPRLPCKDDDIPTVADLSQQLHSSVRTGNLETSLRLLSLGARPNYFHPDRGNTPLHVAVNAGQALQTELLVVHGADPSCFDANGKTPVDCALEAGHKDLAQRLIALQYELTDRLTFYLCGRKPNHQNGLHYFIPSMADSCLDLSDDAKKAQLKLQALSNHLFEELASDVYDEVDRRECDAIWLSTQNHSALVSDTNTVPFLPVNPSFSATRNQGRQKLALFNAKEFATLVLDILNDARRRQQYSNPDLTQGFVDSSIFTIEEDRQSHDYDEVASDEEPGESNSAVEKQEETMSTKVPQLEKGTTTSFVADDAVPMDTYLETKRALATAEARVQQLLQVNASMSHELQLLRQLVQKLQEENSALRVQFGATDVDDSVFTSPPLDNGHIYSNSELFQGKYAAEQDSTANQMADDDDEDDHVPIDDITPYASPGNFLQKAANHDKPLEQSRDPGSPTIKTRNPYDNVMDDEADGEQTDQDRLNSVDSRTDSYDEHMDQDAVNLINEAQNLSKSAPPDPSQEDVVRCTEQITKKIQELLLAAQAGRHSSFIPCSSNILTVVTSMEGLFPEEPELDSVRVPLQLMMSSAARLHMECKSAVLPGNTVDMAFLTQQVIQCAYDIAKAAKQLVTTFSLD